jgi:hypothetical protein
MKKETKKTFTYASLPSLVEKARRKAFKEKSTLSEKINNFINDYVSNKEQNKKV